MKDINVIAHEAKFQSFADVFEILDHMTDGFISVDREWRCTYINRAGAQIAGLAPHDFLGKTLWEMNPGAAGTKFQTEYERAIRENAPVTFTEYLGWIDLWLEVNAYPSASGLSVFFRNVSEQKRAAEKLRASEELLQSTIDTLTGHIAVLDKHGVIVKVNETWRRFAEENLFQGTDYGVGQSYIEACVPDNKELYECDPHGIKAAKGIRRVAHGELDVFELEYPCHSPHQQRWFMMRVTRFNEAKDHLRVVVAHENVTARRLAEIALREGENHLRFALKVGELGFWQVNLSDSSIASSDGCRENFGIAPGEDFPYSRLVGMIHPDDRERQRAAVEQSMATGKDHNCEYRINTPAGELRWIDARGRVVFNEDGKPLYISGTTQNITTRKRGEVNLAFLAEISQDLTRLTSVDEIMQTVSAKIGAYLNLSLCTFVEINEAADQAVITHDWHRADVPGRFGIYRFSDYVTDEFQKAGRAAEIFVVRDTQADSRTDAAQYAALQIGSFLSVPFVRNGEWRFLIAVYHAKPHDWRADEIELMRELTARIWTRLERACAEEAVRVSEEKFRNLANSISQFAWMADASGYVFWYNERWYEYTGTTFEEMQGWGWRKVLHPDHADRVVEKVQHSWDTGEEWEDTFPLRGKDGRYRWFLSRALPIRDEAGRTIRWFGTNTDVTEQLEAEEALRATMEREQALRVKAEEANRLKDEFLATVSHELRTPLTSILGWSAMLQRTDFDAATRSRALATIERNALAQQQIIEDLLEVSRIITGKLRMDTEAVELTQVIEAALDVVRPAAAAKNIHLRAMLDPATAPIAGDAGRLQQIIWNLLTNAVKFTPSGGLVEVQLESVNSHAEITVCDNGNGIDAEFLPYVFDRFRQADGTTKRSHGGLGLGLSIVRHLVEAHGGTVQVSSKGQGQGSTFTIKLPLMPVASSRDGEIQSEPPSETIKDLPSVSPRALEGVRVLLVDDDNDGRQLLSMLLASCGAEVVEAESAAGALALFRQCKPDVIISDIGMPEEDGYDLIRQVRELERGSIEQTPAVALTAYAREDDRARALSTGYQTHLPKPIELASVVAAIAKLVGKATAI